jgi:putative SOS response-associated peptidase YedK
MEAYAGLRTGMDDGSRKAVNLFWGLVPSWAKDSNMSTHLINARRETVRDKPSFRAAFKQRRCLIPANGFYEWQTRDSGKQAFYLQRSDQALIAFAGLWEQWQHGSEILYSCTLITTAATAIMQPIHERMPVIMPPAHYQAWLDKHADSDTVFALLENEAYMQMRATPVGDWVNNPRHDDEQCLSTIHDDATPEP